MRASLLKQRGIGFFGFMLIIALAAFFGTLLFKMGPAYLKYWQVRKAMDSLVKKTEIGEQGPRGAVRAVMRQLDIDGVSSVTEKDFTAQKSADGKGIDLSVSYQEQTPIVFNVDALMHFEYRVVLPTQ